MIILLMLGGTALSITSLQLHEKRFGENSSQNNRGEEGEDGVMIEIDTESTFTFTRRR